MLNLLRSRFGVPTETEEEFRSRMEQLERDRDELSQKQPEEVAGAPQEATYYGLRLNRALAAGEEADARHFLSEMLRTSPNEVNLRLVASEAYAKLGEESEAIAQLGIALALRPENYAVHNFMARFLAKRGEWQAAEMILENGWAYCRKHVSKSDLEAERTKYFSIFDGKQTP